MNDSQTTFLEASENSKGLSIYQNLLGETHSQKKKLDKNLDFDRVTNCPGKDETMLNTKTSGFDRPGSTMSKNFKTDEKIRNK